MAHFSFTPDTVDSTSTPTSDAPSASSPITPHDTHPGYSPGAIYSRSAGQPSPSIRSIHSLHSVETSSGKRRLGLLEYPTLHEDLQFCRDVRDKFKAYERDNPHATPLDLEQMALSSLELLRTTFDDMCHIPPPECVFYQWSYRQSHNADAERSGADVFHLLNSHCYMFDFNPQDNNTDFPVPDKDQVLAILNLIGCQPTSLMLAFGLRRFLRRTTTEGREIFWMIYNTLADLAGCVSQDFLRAQPFLDRNVQLMSTVRAQRGATGALAYSGVFPTRAEVSYAMQTYASETREAAETAGAGLSPAAPGSSPLSLAMHRLDRLFQGIEKPDESAAAGHAQPQLLLEPSPLLLSQNIVGVDESVYPVTAYPPNAPPHPPQQSSDAHEDQAHSTSAPMMTARILRRPPTTCPAFTPVEVTIRPYSPYPLCDTPSPVDAPVLPAVNVPLESTTVGESSVVAPHIFSSRPASETNKESPQPQALSSDPSGPTPGGIRAATGRQRARRRVPPLAAISCSDVTELLQDENVLHEKFLDFVARFHDNVSEYGARSLEKLAQQHRDLVYHRQQQQRRRELAARLRASRGTPYYSHDRSQSPIQPTTETTTQAEARPPAVSSSSTRNSSSRGNNSGPDESGYVYIGIPDTRNSAAYAGGNFGNVFNAPPAPDPYAYHIHNQHGRLLQQAQRSCSQDTSSPTAPPPPPPYEPASQRLQPVIGPPIPYNLALPSLDQTEVVAPQPLRPTLPALVMPPPVPVPRSLMESRPQDRAQNDTCVALLEALHSLPPAPLAEQNEMARQQYERYHQQQQYQLELQRQSQEQDRIMQTYQEQKLQHQRQILTQQAIIQREQLAQFEYMQHQHQIHLLRSLHTHVLQQVEAQRRANRESRSSQNRTPSNDDEDQLVNSYTGYVDDESDAASDVDPEDDYPAVPIMSRGDRDDDVSYIPAFVRSRSFESISPDYRPEDPEPPRYAVSRNRPLSGDFSSLPPSPVATSPSSSPFCTTMASARSGTENNNQSDDDGDDDGGQNAVEDAILYE